MGGLLAECFQICSLLCGAVSHVSAADHCAACALFRAQSEFVLLSCSNSPSWPSRLIMSCLVSVATHGGLPTSLFRCPCWDACEGAFPPTRSSALHLVGKIPVKREYRDLRPRGTALTLAAPACQSRPRLTKTHTAFKHGFCRTSSASTVTEGRIATHDRSTEIQIQFICTPSAAVTHSRACARVLLRAVRVLLRAVRAPPERAAPGMPWRRACPGCF